MDQKAMVEAKAAEARARRLFEKEVENLGVRMVFFEKFGVRLTDDKLSFREGSWVAEVMGKSVRFEFDMEDRVLWLWADGARGSAIEDPDASDLASLLDWCDQ